MPPILTKYKYVRKTDRGKWLESDMEEAIRKVKSKEMNIRDAADRYSVPKSTLGRRVIDKNKVVKNGEKHLGRYRNVFSKEEENEMVNYILDMESRFFGINYTDLRKLAFDFAIAKNIDHQFNNENKMVSKKWLYRVLSRHPELSLRTPEATSYARASGFNKEAVEKFFKNLECIYNKYKLTPDRIWNIDESGVSTVQSLSKILAKRGKRQVGGLTSAERGTSLTVVCAMNAAGSHIAPGFIFARKKVKPELMDNAPNGSPAYAQDKGWMDRDVFLKFINYFVQQTRPSKEKPVLIILDGHVSHTKSLPLINYARENNLIILNTPPHCTHKIQPLDVSYFKSFMTYYDRHLNLWMRNHPGRTFGLYQVGAAVREAFGVSASVQTATNGFRKTGIWPLNPNIFEDYEFAPSKTTERPLENNCEVNKSTTDILTPQILEQSQNSEVPSQSIDIISQNTENINLYKNPQPSGSGLKKKGEPDNRDTKSCDIKIIKLTDIYPLPVASVEKKKLNANKRSLPSTILTESPYKNELENKVTENEKKQQKIVKKKVFQEDVEKENINKKFKKSRKSEKVKETDCPACKKKFSNTKEDWYQCKDCLKWAHETCGILDDL